MTRIRTGAIQVDGLKELNASLKAMGPEFKSEMRKTNKKVADFVAADARAAAYSIGSTAAHVAPSLKASAGAESAGVALGGAAYQMAAGAEFGSNRFHQFQAWRGNSMEAGYFLFPTIRADVDKIDTEYTASITQLIRKVGLA